MHDFPRNLIIQISILRHEILYTNEYLVRLQKIQFQRLKLFVIVLNLLYSNILIRNIFWFT